MRGHFIGGVNLQEYHKPGEEPRGHFHAENELLKAFAIHPKQSQLNMKGFVQSSAGGRIVAAGTPEEEAVVGGEPCGEVLRPEWEVALKEGDPCLQPQFIVNMCALIQTNLTLIYLNINIYI
jgi:hypothetical protein